MLTYTSDTPTDDSWVLTGFEAFMVGERLRANPTIELVDRLAHRVEHTAILPVEYETTGLRFTDWLEATKPTGWLGLGLAADRSIVEVECIALNVQAAASPDNAGLVRKGEPITPGGPLAYRTNIAAESLVSTLANQGLRIATSYHAGTFLCNQVYYQALERVHRPVVALETALFVHIPDTERQPLADTLEVLDAIMDWLGIRPG